MQREMLMAAPTQRPNTEKHIMKPCTLCSITIIGLLRRMIRMKLMEEWLHVQLVKQSTHCPLTNSMPVLLNNNRNRNDRLNLYFLSRIEMEYTVKTVLLVLGCLSSCVSMEMGCIGEFCFTLFDYFNNFTDAKILCQNNASSSNLISISDDETRDAVGQFLTQSNASSSDLIYIDAALQKSKEDTWYLIDGSKYFGGVDPQDKPAYCLYGYISRDARSSHVGSSRPDQRSYFICQLNTTNCSNSSDVIPYQQQCYVKYDMENVTWYEARKRCISNGGDLATFNFPGSNTENYSAPFDASRLIPNLPYWFGLRWNYWSWISSSDGNSETLYDGWSVGKPNNTGYSCVCLDPNGSPKWSWTDCDCSIRRSFLCVKKVPTTTSTTTKATVTTVASPNNNSSQDATANRNLSFEQKLIIGLVVGLGGILLIIVIVVIIIIIIRCRKRNRDVSSTSSSDELQTENHKNQRAGILNNSLSAEDVDGSQYAAVVVNTAPQKKTESSETNPETLYTSFDHGHNKPSDSDETDGRMASRQARETIFAPSADEVYANAQQ